jgi:hypothetical protein
MADWSYFHARLMPRVMGCPVPVANAELRNAAYEFFERTRAWRQWLDWFVVSADVREYDIDVPPGTAVIRLEQATKDGNPMGVEGAFAIGKDPLQYTVSGDSLSSLDRATIVLSGLVPAGAKIQLQASLGPSPDATGIPDHLAQQYADAILAGALFRIRTIPKQSFTDVESASVDIAKFTGEIGRVQALAWRSHTNTQPRSRVRWC